MIKTFKEESSKNHLQKKLAKTTNKNIPVGDFLKQ